MDSYDERMIRMILDHNQREEPIWTTKLITSPKIGMSYMTAHKHIISLLDRGILYQVDGRGVKVSENKWANVNRMMLFVSLWWTMNEDQRERMVRAMEGIDDSLKKIVDSACKDPRKEGLKTKVVKDVQTKE